MSVTLEITGEVQARGNRSLNYKSSGQWDRNKITVGNVSCVGWFLINDFIFFSLLVCLDFLFFSDSALVGCRFLELIYLFNKH